MTRIRDTNPVKARREQQSMLMVELADKISKSPAMVSMVEGGFYPQASTQQKIAEALGSTREELFPAEFTESPA